MHNPLTTDYDTSPLETDHLKTPTRDRNVTHARTRHLLTVALAVLSNLGFASVASAHGGHVYANGIHLAQWYGLVPLLLGIGIVLGSRYLPRLRPISTRGMLYGVFLGLAVTVFGAIWLVQFSPVEWFKTQPVIPRALYEPFLLFVGNTIIVGSVLGGYLEWPTRPRYAGLGVLLGLWVAYPGLSVFGLYTPTSVLGYALVFAVVIAVCYILWRDARGVLKRLYADRTARRFGLAVGALSVVFFMFSSGMLFLIPDDGTGVSLSQRIFAVMPTADPLVMWPAVEFWFPQLPLGGMLSVGTVILVALFGSLIGLNAALFAYQSERSTATSSSQMTSGAAGIAAPQACCCCGPVLSQIAIVTLGPSAAAPIYLLFADPSSSIGSLFFVVSVAIFVGTLVRAGRTASPSSLERNAAPT